jgi:group I intron endonuclease
MKNIKSTVIHIAFCTILCGWTTFVFSGGIFMKFDIDKHLKNESGIYIIKNNIDDRKYIGSTVCFIQRFNQHQRELTDKKHPNPLIQRFVDKYGTETLSMNLVCLCNKDHLRYNESKIIELIKPKWNIKPVDVSDYFPYDTKEQVKNINSFMDDVFKIKPIRKRKLDNIPDKPINEYTPDEAAKYLPF